MNPSPSPRHPWKALAVVLAMFAVVHGARAHVGSNVEPHQHGFTSIHIDDGAAADRDCPDVDVDDDDEPDAAAFVDEDDDDDWN